MRTSRYYGALIACGILLGPSVSAAAERFVLLVTQDIPSRELVGAAAREGAATGEVPDGAYVLDKLTRVYPALLEGPPPRDWASVVEDFRAASEAHYATQLGQAERHFARGFDLLARRPDVLAGHPEALEQAADAAALRYRNAAATGDEGAARRTLEDFVRLHPDVLPPRAQHPPTLFELWETLRRGVTASEGQLAVHALPLDWERAGDCALQVNGADRGPLPQSGRLRLPAGHHHIQVRCGARVGWLQRVEVGPKPVTLSVPVRAQLASQVDPATGVVTLVRPSEGDAGQLVQAISESAGFDGANVVRTAIGRALIGTWAPGAENPSDHRQGVLVSHGSDARPTGITDVTNVLDLDRAAGPSRTWTYVAGGTGLALLAGGVVTHLYREDRIDERGGAANLTANDREVSSDLESAATGLYVAGGLLVGTAVVLFFLDDGGEGEGAAGLGARHPLDLAFRF